MEKIFRSSIEFCSSDDTFNLNVAHIFFMQENKFKEGIDYYAPFVKKHQENVDNVDISSHTLVAQRSSDRVGKSMRFIYYDQSKRRS